jgi:4-amino-4-deoxy-L-arabinose transferase-like glycosyltransferase
MKKSYLALIALAIISLFLNLGLPPLHLEEPRRAIVALEMFFSGNYVTPTIMAEPYYAKPPLFNWLLALSFKIFGSFSEFAVRFPSVLSLLLMGMFNFVFVRRFMNEKIAFYSSMLFITSANIYFYFSLLGEIDLFFSLVTYLCIASIFYFYQKRNFLLLFLSSFFFASVGFLTKGFPSVAFLYVSLLVYLASERQLKKIFSLYHVLGIAVFILVSGPYLYYYGLHNALSRYIQFLWQDSSSRTILVDPAGMLLKHVITYPLETLKALLPYSLLLVFTFRRGFMAEVLSTPVLKFSLLVSVSNYLVYLISPGANQRYIYALYPFLLLVLCQAYFTYGETDRMKEKALSAVVFSSLFMLALASATGPFLKITSVVPHIAFVSAFFLVTASATAVVLSKRKNAVLLIVLFTVIVFRLAFDMVYLPIEASRSQSAESRRNSETMAAMTATHELFLYRNKKLFDLDYIFYIESRRGRILRRMQPLRTGDYFIAEENLHKDFKAEKIFEFTRNNTVYGLYRL